MQAAAPARRVVCSVGALIIPYILAPSNISVAVIDNQNPMERAWLDQLASALNLTPEMAAELERQAQQAG